MATQGAPLGFDAEGMWDRLASTWDARGEWHASVTRELTAAMVDDLALEGTEEFVELACGPTADVATAAARHEPRPVTIRAGDLSARMIEAAERRAQRDAVAVSFQQLDVTDLALPDESVDRLAARWVYMLLPDPGQGLREARRVLRSAGRLVFAVFAAAQDNPFFMLPAGVPSSRVSFTLQHRASPACSRSPTRTPRETCCETAASTRRPCETSH